MSRLDLPFNVNELMMVTGPTGSGKSMFQTMFIGRQIAETDHTIITNAPLRFGDLESVIDEEFGTEWRKRGSLSERIYHTENYLEFRRFWLVKGWGWCVVDIEDEQYEVGYKPDYSVHFRWLPKVLTEADVKKRKPLFHLKLQEVLRLEEMGEVERRDADSVPEVDVVIDEARSYFPQLSKGKLGPGYLHFLDHKRKLRTSVLMGCQFPKQVDSEIRSAANSWCLLQCFAKRRKGMFYLPKQSVWQLYAGPGIPKETDTPDRKGHFSIDGKTWGRAYDTAAGVGLPGGHRADAGAKVGGISWMWFPVFEVVA